MIRTCDGQKVHRGDRVYNYYDLKWGVIDSEPDREGWFTFHADDGSTTLLNGERISTYQPGWAK